MKTIPAKQLLAIAILLGAASSALAVSGHTKGREVAPFTPQFKPGDYVWKPEVSPAGPVVIVVSIPEQKLAAYRNGVRIGSSTVSTGSKGHETPAGVFTVLQKKVDHESSIYKGAKMPHMQRLTWSGIAIQAGHLPGYPASKGCVRLPADFAEKLYSVTRLGTTVIITDGRSASTRTANVGTLLTGATRAPLAPGSFEWQPEKAPRGALSIVFSTADRHTYVYRNGVQIGRARFELDGRVSGSHIYSALATIDPAGRRDWLATTSISRAKAPDLKALASRLSIAPAFATQVRAAIAPGSTLIVTDMPVSPQTRSGAGFGILTADAPL
ncbi:MAG: L,D-transpeptidase [Verrucomicrobia bacterium]|nr:L,D-transpeptidase [Verrucomicrobiota bacterium]